MKKECETCHKEFEPEGKGRTAHICPSCIFAMDFLDKKIKESKDVQKMLKDMEDIKNNKKGE